VDGKKQDSKKVVR